MAQVNLVAHAAGAGTAGSLLAGLFGGSGSIVGAVSGVALLWAVLGAIVAIGAYNLLRQRAFR